MLSRESAMSKGFIPPHGGYKNLLSFQKAEIVYDATVYFCDRFIDKRSSRTHGQMVQAARSGKQNIVEGSMAAATSKETEIKLTTSRAPASKSFWSTTAIFCGRAAWRNGPKSTPTLSGSAS